MLDDMKYALRRLIKSPKFTALTLFVMTTGLSLCIYMIGFLQSTMIAPLPFENGHLVRKVTTIVDGVTYDGSSLRLHEYEELKASQTIFSTFDAYATSGINLSTSDKVMRYSSHRVTPTFFAMSHANTQLGRLFESKDLQAGSDKVAILTDKLWAELYARDSNVIGEKLRLNGENYTIIGVTEKGYSFPDSAELYLPFNLTTLGIKREDSPYVSVHGVLKEGVSDDQAINEVSAYFNTLKTQYPELNSNIQGYVWTYQQEMIGSGGDAIIATMIISVALILILACVNVGNLLLSRAIEQNKEIAIRSALGAPRATIIKQMMWESIVICSISGLFAILMAGYAVHLSVEYFSTSMPIEAPYFWHNNMSPETILLAIFICIATALFTGFLPAWRASATDINAVLRDGTRGAQSKNTGRLSMVIVIAEVALSCALILVSVSMVNAIDNIEKADYGMKKSGYLTARVNLDPTRYESEESRLNYYNNLRDELMQDPAVKGVSYASSMPHTWGYWTNFALEQVDYGKDPNYPAANQNLVDVNFLETMGLELKEGRWFGKQDTLNSPKVAVVTQNFVDKFFPGSSPIGKRMKWLEEEEQWYTIVGVTNSIVLGQPIESNKNRTAVFVPYQQSPRRNMLMAIVTDRAPDLLRTTLNSAALKVDKDTPPYNIQSVEDAIRERIAGMNFISKTFLSFAIASMVLAFSGIYGVMSTSITQKRQEIGVRRALGANDQDVLVHFTKKGFKQLAIGLVIGLPAGIGLVQLMSSAGIAAGSLVIFIGVPVLILMVVLCAIYFPVRQSLCVEPAVILRDE